MPFPSDCVGAAIGEYSHEMQTREILAYASGLLVDDPAFLDDAQFGGLRGLPFQCVSLEWPVALSLRAMLGAVLTAEEAGRSVHASQDSVFHRAIHPGQRLHTAGKVIGVRVLPAGVLVQSRLDTRDIASGELVTTSWSTSIYRGVTLSGDPVWVEEPVPPPEEASLDLPGDVLIDRVAVPRALPHIYSECAAIWNPIHTERTVALAAGLPDIILHGTATWALAGLVLLRRYCDLDPTRLRRLAGRFVGMVIPGGEIEVRHARVSTNVVRFEVLSPDGRAAVSHGFAHLA